MSRAEKFIQNFTRNCSNELVAVESCAGKEVVSYHKWLTPEQARKAVEIAKKETIEKACEYLNLHCNEVKTEDNGIAGWIDNEFIDNFRKAMKDK
jgi:hypothetical protein